MGMIVRHLQDEPVPPAKRSEMEIPPDLDRLVPACLAKDPADRPDSAKALMDLLDTCAQSLPSWTREHAARWWDTHAPETVP
jgi:hypothetical protein